MKDMGLLKVLDIMQVGVGLGPLPNDQTRTTPSPEPVMKPGRGESEVSEDHFPVFIPLQVVCGCVCVRFPIPKLSS